MSFAPLSIQNMDRKKMLLSFTFFFRFFEEPKHVLSKWIVQRIWILLSFKKIYLCISFLSQIEVKLKKSDGLRWITLEKDPTTTEVAQPMPEGRSWVEHIFYSVVLGIKPTIYTWRWLSYMQLGVTVLAGFLYSHKDLAKWVYKICIV